MLCKGHLYSLLENRTYIGQISHKGKIYNGEHEAIIEKEVFERVQELLSQNRIKEKSSVNSINPSLLAGKIFDDKGNYMSPSHSNTRNRRYRYYVSQALIQCKKNKAGSISKIPAGEIEAFVTNEIKSFLSDTKNIQQYIEDYDLSKQKDLLSAIKNIKTEPKDKLGNVFIRTLLSKVVLYKEKVEIIICKDQLIKALEALAYNTQFPEELKEETKTPILIHKNIRISATANNGSVLIISDSQNQKTNINPLLIKAITKSYYWNNLIIEGEVKSSTDILKIESEFNKAYINYILGLRFLSPDIVEAILNGRQPRDLSLKNLFAVKTLDWEEQRKILSF